MEKKGTPGAINPAHLLAKKLQENRESLHITRVPDKTKQAFIALAQKEFCGDYGFLLKHLMDNNALQENDLIVAKIEEHESRLQNLESTAFRGVTKQPEPEEEGRKMLDGVTVIKNRRSKKQ